MKHLGFAGLVVLIVIGLAGCSGGQGGIVIEDPWLRPSPLAEGNGAAYMVIKNQGSESDALLAVEGDVAESIELHMTMHMEGDMMGMEPVDRIDVPATGKAVLEPGGYHVMLIGMKEELQPGATVTLTLVFEKAGRIAVEFEVREE